MKKRNIFMGALLVCTMFGMTSCKDLGAGYDNPIGSYMAVDEQVYVGVGKTVSINPTTISDGNVLYTSSNEKIATVDANGNVTGLMSGEVDITATVEETKGYYSSSAVSRVIVRVEDAEQLAADIAEKTKNKYTWLSLYLAPDAKIEWSEGISLPNKTIDIVGDGEKPATITVGNSIVIQNSFRMQNAKIDAGLTKDQPFVMLAKTEAEADYTIDFVQFYGVEVKNLKSQFFYGNKETHCLIQNFEVNNCIIGIDGSTKKTVFDFNGSGNYANMNIGSSTIYANPAQEQAGGFISTQSAKKISDFGYYQYAGIWNSTFYNISYNKNFCVQRENDKDFLQFNVGYNIFVNCGKSGQLLKGLGGNASSLQKNTGWYVNYNMFMHDGENTRDSELIGNYADADAMSSMYGNVTFKNPEQGDFHQNDTWAGDSRWTN